MNGVSFVTTPGSLDLIGRIYSDSERPVLLTMGGAFPPRDFKHELVTQFPNTSVIICRYPGMHCEPWNDPSPLKVAAAMDEFIGTCLKGRRILAYGLSTGCLVTLNLQSPEVRRQVAQEPFLTTSHMAPFIEYSRELAAKQPESKALAAFLWNIFGITMSDVENRDYRKLLADPTLPLDLIVGAEQSTPPGMSIWPSFTTDEDRRVLLDRPKAKLHVGPRGTGHFVEPTPEARAMVSNCISDALVAMQANA